MSDDTFPDVRWGPKAGPLVMKAMASFGATEFGSWTIRKLTPLDRALLRRSEGRLTVLGPIGAPLLLLTTTGRKTGKLRTTPLVYMRDGDRLFLLGSNFGQQHHPAWTENLIADPNAWVTMNGEEIPVVATLLTGAEHDRVFTMFADYIDSYHTYRGRTDRELRSFALTKR
ncbi:nitroreductase/quinone reductase family protein [Mycolicibacterium mengxianglii]|uniref:nitroreductase/quinone reductase family protein n=1 Tax=Mycolicibacterium mengxianglii TaxID=2736649 RepID=UPI0018D092BB|nr:nitroreductase/quinone reductase family protein [Mycolicibacterium mengxianglii]